MPKAMGRRQSSGVQHYSRWWWRVMLVTKVTPGRRTQDAGHEDVRSSASGSMYGMYGTVSGTGTVVHGTAW